MKKIKNNKKILLIKNSMMLSLTITSRSREKIYLSSIHKFSDASRPFSLPKKKSTCSYFLSLSQQKTGFLKIIWFCPKKKKKKVRRDNPRGDASGWLRRGSNGWWLQLLWRLSGATLRQQCYEACLRYRGERRWRTGGWQGSRSPWQESSNFSLKHESAPASSATRGWWWQAGAAPRVGEEVYTVGQLLVAAAMRQHLSLPGVVACSNSVWTSFRSAGALR